MCLSFFFFFFSSRRRHTRWTGDWSSDVCSSDLGQLRPRGPPRLTERVRTRPECAETRHPFAIEHVERRRGEIRRAVHARVRRSEERRVGKECRSRWGPDHEKKKIGKVNRRG